MSPQITRVICWNILGVYQQTTHRLLKKITEQPNILTRNEQGESVVYGDAIPGSNFKSRFKSMVSNQLDLHQVGIDDFLCALRSLSVKKDEISREPLKIKYKNVAAYGAVQRHSTTVKFEHENIDKAADIWKPNVFPPSSKQPS